VSCVEEHYGGYSVAGSRVSLDSIVYAFLGGQTAESIAASFPTLDLERVRGAIAFYLAHAAQIDRYLSERRAEFEMARAQSRIDHPAFRTRLEAIKRGSGGS
jgi:uncharacterized protein (DUF433 family)